MDPLRGVDIKSAGLRNVTGYFLRPQHIQTGDHEVSTDQWPVSLDKAQHSADRYFTETIRFERRSDDGDLLVHSVDQVGAIA